jgi:hypothetical protein
MQKALSLFCATLVIFSCSPTSPQQGDPSSLLALGSAAEDRAFSAFQAIPNKADKEYLDDFISRYRGSAVADVALTFRFQATQTAFRIEDYNEFVERYGDTLAGKLATFEVYQLYDARQNLPSYLDFVSRYPNSPEAMAARSKIHLLMFEFAKDVAKISDLPVDERIAALDDFVFVNGKAPQVPSAIMMAKLLLLDAESKKAKSFEADVDARSPNASAADREYLLDLARRNRANELVTEFETTAAIIEELLEEKGLRYDAPSQDPQVMTWRLKAERLAFVIQTVYKEQPAVRAIRDEQRYVGLLRAIGDVSRTIKEENAKLIAAMREEFAKTREVLQDGFSQLAAQLAAVNNRLDTLHKDLELTNQKLAQINGNIETVIGQLASIDQKLARSNQLMEAQVELTKKAIAIQHADLQFLHDALKNMNRDMNRNAEVQNRVLTAIGGELQRGFQALHQDNVEAAEQNREMRAALVAELRTVNSSVVAGAQSIRNQLEVQTRQAAQFHLEDLRQNAQLHAQLERTIVDTSAQEVRAMNANANALRQDIGILGDRLHTDLRELNSTVMVTGQRTIQAIDNSATRITDTIVRQTDRVVYSTDRVFNAVTENTRVMKQEFRQVNDNLRTIAQGQDRLSSVMASQAIAGAAKAGTSTSADLVGVINGLLTNSGTVEGAASAVCSSIAGNGNEAACEAVAKGIAGGEFNPADMKSFCQGLGNANDREACGTVLDGIASGGLASGDVGRIGGKYLCSYMKVDPSLDCGALGEMVATGSFSIGGIAKAGAEFACKQANVRGVNCSDIGAIASVASDIYSGNWVAAGQTVLQNLGRLEALGETVASRGAEAISNVLAGDLNGALNSVFNSNLDFGF